MELIEVRPRFRKKSPRGVPELLNDLNELLMAHPTKMHGQIVHHHATIKIPDEQLHFWSPQLTLSFEEKEDGSLIRGMYGPRPHIWLGFMFLYFLLGFITLVVLIVGLSQLNLGLTAYILWTVPFALGGFFVLWFSSKAGQKLAHEQIWQIHNIIKPIVLKDAVDVEADW